MFIIMCSYMSICIFLTNTGITGQSIVHNHVPVISSVLFDNCCHVPSETSWKFNDSFLFFHGKQVNAMRWNESVSLVQNNALHICPVDLTNEGIYSCVCGDVILLQIILRVFGKLHPSSKCSFVFGNPRSKQMY